jgi:hypothetical protein
LYIYSSEAKSVKFVGPGRNTEYAAVADGLSANPDLISVTVDPDQLPKAGAVKDSEDPFPTTRKFPEEEIVGCARKVTIVGKVKPIMFAPHLPEAAIVVSVPAIL